MNETIFSINSPGKINEFGTLLKIIYKKFSIFLRICDIYVGPKPIKLSEENIRQKCYDVVFVSDFLAVTSIHRKQKKKWINWVLLYYFNCASKDTMSRVKENPQYERKYSQIIDLMRFLISRIYEDS